MGMVTFNGMRYNHRFLFPDFFLSPFLQIFFSAPCLHLCREDGGQYEGHWKEDHRHGYGVHRWKDGRVFKGEFAQDRFLGETKIEE